MTVYAIGLCISSPSEINFIMPFKITPATRVNGTRLQLKKDFIFSDTVYVDKVCTLNNEIQFASVEFTIK